MSTKKVLNVFLLGRPGCGKSSAAKYVINHMHNRAWSAERVIDFNILKKMSQQEQHRLKFRPVPYDGFEVTDSSVLTEALQILNQQLTDCVEQATTDKILLIEFARGNYEEALHYFSPCVLHDAYFLCIDVDLEMCMQRIKQRMIDPVSLDDHYISNATLVQYYTWQKFPGDHMYPGKIEHIDNNGSLEEFTKHIDAFVKKVIA